MVFVETIENKKVIKFFTDLPPEKRYWIRHKVGKKWYMMSFQYTVFEVKNDKPTNKQRNQ